MHVQCLSVWIACMHILSRSRSVDEARIFLCGRFLYRRVIFVLPCRCEQLERAQRWIVLVSEVTSALAQKRSSELSVNLHSIPMFAEWSGSIVVSPCPLPTYIHTQKRFEGNCSARRPDARFRCAAVREVSTSSCAEARFRAAQAIVVFWMIFVFLGGTLPWAARLPHSMSSHK